MQHIDVVTLSSTHLPFVRDQLMEMYPTIKFIDPSIIVARNIKKLLINNNLVKKIGHGRMRILVSDKKFEFQEILRRLGIREKVEEVFWSV